MIRVQTKKRGTRPRYGCQNNRGDRFSKRSSGGGLFLCLGGCVIAFGRFDDQAIADRLCRDLDSHDLSVNQSADPLDVGLEGSAGDAGNFSACPAEMPCLAASGDTAARVGFFAGKITYP